jgi:hypothetical protein
MSETNEELSNWRKVLFRLSLVAALVSALAMVADWAAPFPLVHFSDGSLGISPWVDRVFLAGLASCALAIMLASFGRGKWRFLTIALGAALLILSLFGFLGSNR